MKHTLSLILILFIPTFALAGDKTGIGFVFGPTYGGGLSYETRNTQTGTSFQVSTFPFLTSSGEGFILAGATFFKTINQGDNWGLFWSAGGMLAHVWERYDKDNLFILGPGIGVERRYDSNLSFRMGLSVNAFFADEEFVIVPYPPGFALTYFW